MLMSSHGCGINEVDFPIHIAFHIQSRLQFGKHPVPDTRLAPALEAAVDRGPLAIPFRQVSPRCSGPQHPDDPVEEFPMILRRSSTARLDFREQRFDPLPLFSRQVASVAHAG